MKRARRAKRRPLNLVEYGISEARYKELFYFCQRYREMQQEAEGMLALRSSVPQRELVQKGEDGKPDIWAYAPRGTNGKGDPVAAAQERREKLLDACRMIESSAKEADALLAKWILKFETSDINVRQLKPPCGERQFVAARKKFYIILHHKRCG